MSEWRKVAIGELVTLRQGFAINVKSKHYISKEQTSLALLRIADMKSGSREIFVKEDIPQNFIAKPQDIIYTRTGNVGLVFRNNYGVVHNNCFTVTPNDECILSRDFLYYLLQSHYFFEKANSLARGAAQPDLPHTLFNSIEISYPNLDTQQRITTILSRYDSLIENYQKQIKLLEESAQRLYKEWFIDLRFPGHENTKIVDGVPEGWEKKKIFELGKVVTGKTPSTANKANYGGNIPFITIPDMHSGIYPTSSQTLSNQGAESQSGKYIPENSLMVSCIGTAGLVCISETLCQTNQQINSLVLDNVIRLYYMYFTFLSLKEHLNNIGSNGATMTNVNKSKFENIEVVVPTDSLLFTFDLTANSTFVKIKNLSHQIRHLTEARDRLLPKLMSGEIIV
mgnify:CR=1 FL=1